MKTPNYMDGLKLFAHKYKKNHIYQKIRKRKKTRIWVWRSVLGFGHL